MTSLDLFAFTFMVALCAPTALCLVQKTVGGPLTPYPASSTAHRNIFVLIIVVLYRAMVKTSVPVADPTLEIPLPRRRRPRKAFGPKGRRVPPRQQVTERKLLVIVLVVFLVEERRHERVNSKTPLNGPRQPLLLGWDPSVSFLQTYYQQPVTIDELWLLHEYECYIIDGWLVDTKCPSSEVEPEVKPTGCKSCYELGRQCTTCELGEKEEYYQGLDGNKLLDTLYALQEELELAKSPVVLPYRKPRVDRDPVKDVRYKRGMERRTSNRLFKGSWL